jgi:hypothetical protein
MDLEPVLIFTGLCAAAASALFFGGRLMARRALNPRLTVAPIPAKIGQPLTVTLDLYPAQDVQVDQIDITLACNRVLDTTGRPENELGNLVDLASSAFSNPGSQKYLFNRERGTRESDVLCKEHIMYPINRLFRKGVGERLDYEVLVSPDGVGTRGQGELTASWQLTVRFAIPGFPDALIEREIEVAPRYGV